MIAVYRLFDASDVLLYIGVTKDLERRLVHHRRFQPWWEDVARHSIEEYADRAAAELAEMRAIHAEQPRHNYTGVKGARRHVLPQLEEIIVEDEDSLPADTQSRSYGGCSTFNLELSERAQ